MSEASDISTLILHTDQPTSVGEEEKIETLCVDGFMCPLRFLHIITPMEFEELVVLFKQYDVDRSGTLDKHEIRKVLHSFGQVDSLERAEALLDIIDEDRNGICCPWSNLLNNFLKIFILGTINFDEFCRFFVLLKEGDSRLQNLQLLLSKIHDTPLGALEKQAKLRDLKIRFVFIDQKEADANTPPRIILEVWKSLFLDFTI